MGKATGRFLIIRANLAGDEFPECDTVTQLVDQTRRQRQLRQITFYRLHRTGRVGQHAVQLRLRTRLCYARFPLAPNLIIHALDGHFGFRGLLGPHIGFNGAFEGADTVDVGFHAKLVEQAFIIWLRSAGSRYYGAAQRVHPDLRGMGRQLIAVVRIGGGEGIDRLARLF